VVDRLPSSLETAEMLFQRSSMLMIDPSMPSKSFEKLANRLARRHAALLIQLWSGHVPLNKYLHKIGKAVSPMCAECGKEESVHHYLLTCKRYEELRRKMEHKLSRSARSLSTLLANPLAMPALFQYIGETERFKDTREDFQFTEDEKTKWKEQERNGKNKGREGR
jgi:hypothetical protein